MVNFKELKSEIDNYPGVSLMAVSKTYPYSDILKAYDQGARLFGENRVQEILDKFPPVENRPNDMYLALIGHLQSNKVKKVIKAVNRIDSVDSVKLLEKIENECEKLNINIDILFEYNSSNESQKSGFTSYNEIVHALEILKKCKRVSLKGIMTVGPLGFDREKNIIAFKKTKALFDRLNNEHNLGLNILSMGMSNDYIDAIAEGSNLIRVGSKIFGERSYNV